MKIQDSVVFVTGANRGLGLAFAKAALAAGARKVYAAARDPGSIALAGVEAIALDVTQPAQVEAAARACGDVTLLISNAGISRGAGLLGSADAIDAARAEFETNFFGPLGARARIRASAQGQWRRRDRQRAVGAELAQPAGCRDLQRVEGGRMVAQQRAA